MATQILDESTASAIELRAPGTEQDTGTALPRADGGSQAYLALSACFVIEALVWGFPYVYGVFASYYSTHEPFSEQGGIAAIASTALGIMYISAPFALFGAQRYPQYRRPALVLGLIIQIIAVVSASFCNSTTTLLVTQGVLFALGGVFMTFTSLSILDEWFIARKGLAYGIVWAGNGIAGALLPFFFEYLLSSHGFRFTLRVWAGVMTALIAPAIYFLKPRLPITQANIARPSDWGFLKRVSFWIFAFGTMTQSMAFFMSTQMLPSFAQSQGFPSFAGPLALALLNGAACGGNLLNGYLVDRFHATVAIFFSSAISMVAVFVLWGLTTTQAMLYAFALVWGVSGGGYPAIWSGFAKAIRGPHGGSDGAATIIALMAASKGVGSLISGPMTEKLLQAGSLGHSRFAYGSDYGSIIVFSGINVTLGGTALLGKKLKLL